MLEVLEHIEGTQNEGSEDANAIGTLRRMELQLGTVREDLARGRWAGRKLVGYRPAE